MISCSENVLRSSWKYSFIGTTVTLLGFRRSVAKPVIASSATVVAFVGLNTAAPMDGALVSLSAATLVALLTYLGCFAVIPGGWSDSRRLMDDFSLAVKRSSA